MTHDDALGPTIDVHELFPLEQSQLLGILSGLSKDQWKLPTACAGWDVKDVAAHILGDHLHRLSGARDGFHVGGPRPGEAFPAFIHRINDEWVVAARTLSPRVLVDLLADAAAGICDYWASVELTALSLPVSWAGPDPAPMWLDMARDYTEYWIHQQQIREAAGIPGLEDPQFRDPVVDIFMRALPFTLRNVTGGPVSYEVSGRMWSAARKGEGWALRTGSIEDPVAMVRTDTDTFWRLCTKNATVAEVRNKIVTEGDQAIAQTMLGMVSIII